MRFIVPGAVSATAEAQDYGILRAEGKAGRAAEKDPELQHAEQCKEPIVFLSNLQDVLFQYDKISNVELLHCIKKYYVIGSSEGA